MSFGHKFNWIDIILSETYQPEIFYPIKSVYNKISYSDNSVLISSCMVLKGMILKWSSGSVIKYNESYIAIRHKQLELDDMSDAINISKRVV